MTETDKKILDSVQSIEGRIMMGNYGNLALLSALKNELAKRGLKIVPREPAEKQIDAGECAWDDGKPFVEIYTVMVDAMP